MIRLILGEVLFVGVNQTTRNSRYDQGNIFLIDYPPFVPNKNYFFLLTCYWSHQELQVIVITLDDQLDQTTATQLMKLVL